MRSDTEELRNMEPAQRNLFTLTLAYRRIWVNTGYSTLGTLRDILEANNCSIFDWLSAAKSNKSGRRVRQIGIKMIHGDEASMKNAYERRGGLCTVFALKVILESGRILDEFTIGNNMFHRLAWDNEYFPICSAKKVVEMGEISLWYCLH